MKFNKSIENSENSSSIIIPDILDQIKKRSEELSTSEASIRLLQNLSNPTNLTNPFIINTLNQKKNQKIKYYLPSLVNKRAINKNNDIISNRILSRSKSDIIINNPITSATHDLLDLPNYQKLIEKAEEDFSTIQQKKRKKKILEKINKTIDVNKNIADNNNKNINEKTKNFNDIWEKLKRSKGFGNKIEKDLRIDINKFLPRRQAIEKSNIIRIINYNNKNKDERYNKIIEMKKLEIKSTDNIIKKLEKSKNYLGNKYEEEYKMYIRFLNKKYEEESFKNDDIIKQKNIILKDIDKLKRDIEKIIKLKQSILDWIYIQIQVKEKKIILPEYYKYIIETNIPYESIKKITKGKYNLNLKEYNKIKEYKKNYIYEEPKKFFKDLDEIQMESLNKLDRKLEIYDEIKILNKELDILKSENLIIEKRFNEKYKQLSQELTQVKKENTGLELRLIQVKAKKPITRTYKDNYLINKLALFAKMNSNEDGMKFILKNDKPTIFYITICLYNILLMRDYPELHGRKLILDWDKSDEYNMMLIFQYAADVIDILNKEKENYLSNKKFREEYNKIMSEMEKKVRKERAIVQVKMQKKLEMEKVEKLKEKINKKYYKQKRKIDFDYYRKEGKNKNRSLDIDIKRQTRLEDFLYDIDS